MFYRRHSPAPGLVAGILVCAMAVGVSGADVPAGAGYTTHFVSNEVSLQKLMFFGKTRWVQQLRPTYVKGLGYWEMPAQDNMSWFAITGNPGRYKLRSKYAYPDRLYGWRRVMQPEHSAMLFQREERREVQLGGGLTVIESAPDNYTDHILLADGTIERLDRTTFPLLKNEHGYPVNNKEQRLVYAVKAVPDRQVAAEFGDKGVLVLFRTTASERSSDVRLPRGPPPPGGWQFSMWQNAYLKWWPGLEHYHGERVRQGNQLIALFRRHGVFVKAVKLLNDEEWHFQMSRLPEPLENRTDV